MSTNPPDIPQKVTSRFLDVYSLDAREAIGV